SRLTDQDIKRAYEEQVRISADSVFRPHKEMMLNQPLRTRRILRTAHRNIERVLAEYNLSRFAELTKDMSIDSTEKRGRKRTQKHADSIGRLVKNGHTVAEAAAILELEGVIRRRAIKAHNERVRRGNPKGNMPVKRNKSS